MFQWYYLTKSVRILFFARNSSRYDDWLRSVDWDFSIFPIFRVARARLALHASPPRIVELGTKKFVFGNLHNNAETTQQKKNRKILILMTYEGSEILKQERISNFDFSKISPATLALPATPPKQRVPSLKKGYGCSCKPFTEPTSRYDDFRLATSDLLQIGFERKGMCPTCSRVITMTENHSNTHQNALQTRFWVILC